MARSIWRWPCSTSCSRASPGIDTIMTCTDRSFTLKGGKTGFLLIHGLGGTPLELKFVAKGLARRGFTVHCCQLAGHCGDEQDLLATGWRDWHASGGVARDRMRASFDTVIVGGLSMG